ncbi:hypothetical protein AB0H71_00615 [Nocardia sp. NPDC050697]|uniref:hypothetical protein n=1 Tax=Nocardia sp. NPDC050697 TaxID=3155158 RepID=UPI00340A6F6F
MIANARRWKHGDLPRERLLELLAPVRDERKRARLVEAVDEIDDYEGDFVVVEGDLHVRGDLDPAAAGAFLLVVTGDLTVDGVYTDSDDPETFLLVGGDLRARDVVTAGWLEVGGDLRANRVVGDYNDCAADIGGSVHCALFYGEQHHFTMGGELAADVVIGRPRLAIGSAPAYLELDDPRLLEHLDRSVLRLLDDEAEDGNPLVLVDGIGDFRALKRRVRAGLPIGPERTR